jgi:hypothetical protein
MAAKKKIEEQNQTEVMENETVETETVTKTEPVSNIVNGIEFRATKLQTTTENNTISFNFVDGSKVDLDVSSLSEEVKQDALLYGLTNKVKAALAGKKTLQETIDEVTKQVKGIQEGNFYLKSMSVTAELTLELKAFAKVKSLQAAFVHWADISNPVVVSEVLEFWKGLDRAAKNRVARNTNVMAALIQLKAEAGIDSSLEV